MTQTGQPDDLEAVRTLVSTLQGFSSDEQERIIRWTREKLGLPTTGRAPNVPDPSGTTTPEEAATPHIHDQDRPTDIRSFVAEKNPSSDNQFAATIAYYYRFVAPESQRKGAVTAQELQEAARQAGRRRLGDPGTTLRNAKAVGLLDQADRGQYAVNAVGENLVAMSLGDGRVVTATRKKSANRKKAGKKKRKASKKKSKRSGRRSQ